VLRMAADDFPVLVGELLGMKDAIGPRELADVVEQPGEVDGFLLALAAAELDRDRLRVARDGGAMAHRRRIPKAESLHEGGWHRPSERGELTRARVELFRAELRAHERGR